MLLLAGIVCILGCLHCKVSSLKWGRGGEECEFNLIDTVRGKMRLCFETLQAVTVFVQMKQRNYIIGKAH